MAAEAQAFMAAPDFAGLSRLVARKGNLVVLSPWHLHRQTRLWEDPDAFDPGRWGTDNGRRCAREAFILFSAGPRVCPGAGFAMAEGVVLLAAVLAQFRIEPVRGEVPEPVAHLTVRAREGIWLDLRTRTAAAQS